MNQDAINIPELDWMIYTELPKSHANVEEWTEYKCREVDFITHQFTGTEYKYFERSHIARYEFNAGSDPTKNDRHHFNNFMIKHGVKVKEGASILTDGPALVEDADKMEVEIIQEGKGDDITEGSIVVIHYTGKFEDGTVFDSSLARKLPYKFK